MSADASGSRARGPIEVAIIAYKAALGLGEVVVGTILAIPGLDAQKLFARLVAEELKEDPGDRFVAFASRHLPSLIQHRYVIAATLIALGIARLIAAGAMWRGKEWGHYLLLAIVAGALPFDVRHLIVAPGVGAALLVIVNVSVVVALWILLRHLGSPEARPAERASSGTPE